MTQQTLSSSFTCPWIYSVFLSFRGADIRNGFAGHLYKTLCDKGIKTFIDDEDLQKGEKITPTLVEAIEQSRIAIVIFSENYASSVFCLEELEKIVELMEKKRCFVQPVYYKVAPDDVRYQEGAFGKAFDKLIAKRFKNNTVIEQKWKSDLKAAASLSGCHFREGYEYKFISEIIDVISKRITRTPLHVANNPVGLHSHVEKVKTLLQSESNGGVNMVGIYGIGGIGKTTIACAVYNLIADQFEGVCFLENISDTKHDLAQLQRKLLVDILGEKDIKLGSAKEGITIIQQRLAEKKVLLILDDVEKLEQLHTLAGGFDWFGTGSEIIITTRDKHLLDAHCVERKYEVMGLNRKEALELFSWNAFKRRKVEPSYMDLAMDAVSYSNGLPLALEVMGSNLCKRSRDAWESALQGYQRIPIKSIYTVLKVSYDCLEEYQQKIFLDLACFFQGAKLEFVTNTLIHGRDLDPRCGIKELVDKSLVKIDQWNCVRMHDSIRDMGREIVRQESPLSPGKRSRLWYSENIIRILEEDEGTESIEVMLVNLPRNRKVQWDGEAFKKMKNLQVLIIKTAEFSTDIKHLPSSLRFFEWDGYPFSTLSSKIRPRNLVSLNLPNSRFMFDRPLEKFESLTLLNLSGNKVLTQVPNISELPNLEELWLKGCLNLTEIHDSVGIHSKIRVLDAEGCTELCIFPRHIMMKSLEYLGLSHCSSLRIFPEITGKMENLIDIKLDYSGIENLPFTIQNVVGLQHIWLQGCSGLSRLPSSILNLTLPKLEDLNFRDNNNVKRRSLLKYTSSNRNQGRTWLEELVDLKFKDHPMRFLKRISLMKDEEDFKVQNWIYDFFSTRQHMSNWELSRLNSSNFTILPETTELQSTNENLWTVSCSWLSSESVSMLLSEAFHKIGLRNLLMPGSSVPEWFHHCSKGPSLSFWYKNCFPSIAVCAIVSPPRRTFVEFQDVVLIINGTLEITFDTGLRGQTLVTDHILVFDLGILMEGHRVNSLTSKHGWNHVEISGITYRQDFVTWMGVYNLWNWEQKEEDISYARPNRPPRRTFDDLELQEDPTMKDHPALPERLDAKLPIMYYNDVTPIIWEAIWNMQAPPTIKILLWEICKHDLPTCQSLFQKKISDSSLCPICKEEDETLEHLFLLCPWTQPIWFESDFQWIVDFNSSECIEVWLWQRLQIIKRVHPNFNQVNALLGCICWAIWNGRNDFVFEGEPINPMHALKRAETMYKEYFGPSLGQQIKLPQFSVYYKIGESSEQPAPESQSVQEGHHSELDSGIYNASQSLELAPIPKRRLSNFKSALERFFEKLKPNILRIQPKRRFVASILHDYL